MWYDGNVTLTHNCLFNFIVGNRGCGKSYWAKRWCIKDFLKTGSQFIYLRRYDTELDEIETYFNDIKNEFPHEQLEVKADMFFINGDLAGYAFPLSTASTLKSNPYPLVNKIVYDEFIIEQGVHRYLKSEVKKFLDFYETINRLRTDPNKEVKVFFLSNAITMTNPYFLFFDLKLPYGKNVMKKNDILLQLVADVDFIEAKKKTRFGQIIAGTDFEKYSVENKFMLDNDNFVEKKSGTAKYYFTMNYMGNAYGVWIDYTQGKMFVSENIDPLCKFVYSITLDDHTPNTMLLQRIGGSPLFKMFIDSYKLGVVYFETINVKNISYEIIKKCIL